MKYIKENSYYLDDNGDPDITNPVVFHGAKAFFYRVKDFFGNIWYAIVAIFLLIFLVMFILTAANGGFQFLTGGKNLFGGNGDTHQSSDEPCVPNGPGVTSC